MQFDYEKCRFGVQREKEGTGRISMWREGIANSYTLEATFCGFGEDPLTGGYHFNFLDYEKMGHQFCETLLDFCDPDEAKRELVLAELERLRNLARVRRGGSVAGSMSDYSSEECSSLGIVLKVGEIKNFLLILYHRLKIIPSVILSLIESRLGSTLLNIDFQKKKKLPKRKSLVQRQRESTSHSPAMMDDVHNFIAILITQNVSDPVTSDNSKKRGFVFQLRHLLGKADDSDI
ncbi:unnamed protein product [Echinostoma caproni]|uniref:Uncharacterized protein n=1 Tax=Echinostoma caproni TaxID=27848 RepID=A0A183ACF5_9TREM|nr:unnamed protein product [Echinostoma caproni]